MEDALTEAIRDVMRRGGFVLATAAAMTFLAPWGTQAIPLPRRAFDWLACGVIWETAIWLARDGVSRRRRGADAKAGRPPFGAYLLTLGIASIPAVPISMLIVNGSVGTAGDFAAFYAYALGLGLILAAIRYGLRSDGAARGHLAAGTVGSGSPTALPVPAASMPARDFPTRDFPVRDFLVRHAPDLAGATLLALAAEDHYLRIHTDRGQALILLRLRDAIDSLGADAGLQVHRSFWVAMDAAPRVARRGQSWQLELPTGLNVPVSKANVPACRAVGWL